MPVSGTGFSKGDENWTELARGPKEDNIFEWVEAAYVWPHNVGGIDYYFLFVNWGACCSGIDSTYEIRVGKSTEPMGPFIDKDDVDLMEGGGSLFLSTTDYMIGPGHVGTSQRDDIDIISFHYYDSRRSGFYEGLAWMAERRLDIQNGWPVAGELVSSYDDSVTPTQAPVSPPSFTCSDSTEFFSAVKPGDMGWTKMKSCDGWVIRKSTAWRCKNVSGVKENCPDTCTNCCVDTEDTFNLLGNGKSKTCFWAADNPDIRCKKPPTRQLCAVTCGECD